jgi:hypothetical protein
MKLAVSLLKKRTCTKWGVYHFCVAHNEIVDEEHVDICSLLQIGCGKPTEVVKPLAQIESIYDLEQGTLCKLAIELKALHLVITQLET